MAPVTTGQGEEEELMTKELQEQHMRESRQQCEAALKARFNMNPADQAKMDELAATLKPRFLCHFCKNLLLEPWLVKDCGHLYCFKCLHTMIYEQQTTGCPACGVIRTDDWNQDSFGAFKVILDANNNRKVGREGSKFLYDDPCDSIVRMMWPDRVSEYVQCDLEREHRRLEDLAARKHFEISVQNDRLANPSHTNPGMAAGRSGRASTSRRGGTRLRAPPLKLVLPIVDPCVPTQRYNGAADSHLTTILLMPMQNSLSTDMRSWGEATQLLKADSLLPALLKPYLQIPADRVTISALKVLLAELLQNQEHWHDSLHHYPAADTVDASQIALYVEWTQRDAERTPMMVLEEELPDDEEMSNYVAPNEKPCSLLAIIAFLQLNHINMEHSLDLIYCIRPPSLQT